MKTDVNGIKTGTSGISGREPKANGQRRTLQGGVSLKRPSYRPSGGQKRPFWPSYRRGLPFVDFGFLLSPEVCTLSACMTNCVAENEVCEIRNRPRTGLEMNSRVEKVKINLVCTRCSKRIRWAWVIKYHSYQFTQFVYICSRCENVIKVVNAGEDDAVSDVSVSPTVPGASQQ